MPSPTDSGPQSDEPYPRLSKKERKEFAEDLAEMVRSGELRPAKNKWKPITIKKPTSEELAGE